MKPILRNLELILTAIGVFVVLVIFLIFRDGAPWKAAAICAVAVSVIHGIIFYVIRSRQRKARNTEVFSIRDMLDNMVNNLTHRFYIVEQDDNWRDRAQLALWEIQARLNYIEAENLKAKQPASSK